LSIQIAKTGNINLLNAKNNEEAWEEIVRKNCAANEVQDYKNLTDALRSQALLVNQYINDKAHIMKLAVKVDKGSIEYLRNKGYKIDTSSTEDYAESLNDALKKRENLRTRINMKRKEIERINLQNKHGEEKGLEQILASMSYHIGFQIGDEISLARFNEYSKIIKAQNAQAKQNGRNK